jgi:phosphoglycerol geranylgeranyltransferase
MSGFKGKVLKYYEERLAEHGALLSSLIDPDKQHGDEAVRVAKQSYENGADVLLVGGSIGAQGAQLDDTVRRIREATPLPVVLFPGNIAGVTEFAHAIYFMQMLNSRDVYWLATAQIQAAPVVARLGLEVIPTTYVVVEPGQAVGWIGAANPVPRDRPDLAAACGLAARFMGARALLIDAGSGAPEPASPELVKGFAKGCGPDVFFSVGGGVRTPEQARGIIAAGAQDIRIGTFFEAGGDIPKKIKQLAQAIHEEGKRRR